MYLFLNVYERGLLQQKNNFVVNDDINVEMFLNDLGFSKIGRNIWKMEVCTGVFIYAWVWPECIWVSGDLDDARGYIYDVCTQFCDRGCERFI